MKQCQWWLKSQKKLKWIWWRRMKTRKKRKWIVNAVLASAASVQGRPLNSAVAMSPHTVYFAPLYPLVYFCFSLFWSSFENGSLPISIMLSNINLMDYNFEWRQNTGNLESYGVFTNDQTVSQFTSCWLPRSLLPNISKLINHWYKTYLRLD